MIQQLLDEWANVYNGLASAPPQAKLPEEVGEFIEAQSFTRAKLEEGADVVIVVLTQLAYDGFNVEELKQAVQEKLIVNVNRKWRLKPNGTISHIKGSGG